MASNLFNALEDICCGDESICRTRLDRLSLQIPRVALSNSHAIFNFRAAGSIPLRPARAESAQKQEPPPCAASAGVREVTRVGV